MSASAPLTFTTSAHYPRYLPVEGGPLDIIVTVVADDGDEAHDPPGPPALAEVVLLDCSGSMGAPQTKIHAARQAAVAAIDALPDGVAFAVVAGTQQARMVYPADRSLAVADGQTRAAARGSIRHLNANGGTAMSTWLLLAQELLGTRPEAIGHAIMLTDGRNQSERRKDLDAALVTCTGRFTVDCRAIGSVDGVHDWDGAELLRIAEAMGANPVVPIEDVSVLAEEFVAMLDKAMTRLAGDVRLRVGTPAFATVGFVKQVYPLFADLTERGVPAGARTTDYPMGAWSPGDRRDYHLRLEVGGAESGTSGRAGWLSTHAGPAFAGQATTEAKVDVEWSDIVARHGGTSAPFIHYTSQQDHAYAVRLGLQALQGGRIEEAENHVGKAVALAHMAGDREKSRLLARIADIDDAATGRVRLKPGLDLRLWQPLIVLSAQSSQWRERPPLSTLSPADDVVVSGPCAHCGAALTGPFCEECGTAVPGPT